MFLIIIFLQETLVTCHLLGLSFIVSIPRTGYSSADRESSSNKFLMEALVALLEVYKIYKVYKIHYTKYNSSK